MHHVDVAILHVYESRNSNKNKEVISLLHAVVCAIK